MGRSIAWVAEAMSEDQNIVEQWNTHNVDQSINRPLEIGKHSPYSSSVLDE